MPDEVDRTKPSFRDIKLRSIDLWDCQVRRGGSEGEVDKVTGGFEFKVTAFDDSLLYFVAARHEFQDDEGENVLTLNATHKLVYNVENADLLEERDVEHFSASVTMQVIPFHREFVASMSGRLGIPPFLIPLVRTSQLSFSVTGEEAVAAIE